MLIFLWNTLGNIILIEFVSATYLYYWRGWKNIYCFIFHLSKRKEKQRLPEIKECVEEARTISQVPKIPISFQNKPLSFVSVCIRPQLYWAAHLLSPRSHYTELHWLEKAFLPSNCEEMHLGLQLPSAFSDKLTTSPCSHSSTSHLSLIALMSTCVSSTSVAKARPAVFMEIPTR